MHIGSEIDNALHQQLNQGQVPSKEYGRESLIIDDDKPFREALAESVRDFGRLGVARSCRSNGRHVQPPATALSQPDVT